VTFLFVSPSLSWFPEHSPSLFLLQFHLLFSFTLFFFYYSVISSTNQSTVKPFIGRVRRTQVENDMFTTLDEVSVYLRDFKPLGVTLPLCRTVWQITSWDVTEGIPLRCFEIRKDSLRGTSFSLSLSISLFLLSSFSSFLVAFFFPSSQYSLHFSNITFFVAFWHERAIGAESFLYCRPVYQTTTNWRYGVSEQESSITYACLYSNTLNYGPYIPPKRNHSASSSLED
jgi:hypothetical protein